MAELPVVITGKRAQFSHAIARAECLHYDGAVPSELRVEEAVR